MIRRIYSLCFRLAIPAILLRLMIRGRKQAAYKERIAERFGFTKFIRPNDSQPTIWIHAASVGETVAIAPLAEKILAKHPGTHIIFTTMTPTGSECAKKTLSDKVSHAYIPYDYPGAVKRFLDKTRPSVVVIMETELWPNIIHYCDKREIPMIIANGRLSPHSTKGYKKIKFFLKPFLQKINCVAAQSELDQKRFREIGCMHERVKCFGNIKYDIKIPSRLVPDANKQRKKIGIERLVWVAGSTHKGEEELLLEAHKNILKKQPNSLLILAPRHPERFDEVAELCKSQGFITEHRSINEIPSPETQVLVVDQMGVLLLMYAIADLTFIGGSLVTQGGHNPIEAIAVNRPVITGQSVFNFHQVYEQLFKANGAIKVKNSSELTESICELFLNHKLTTNLIKNAKDIFEKNQGALERHLKWIEQMCEFE